MAESVHDKLERAQKILSVVTEGGYLPAVKGASTAITDALAQLSEMERDREAMEKLRREPGDLRWFGETEHTKP